MSATNSTTNYNLPIFIASDSPKWLVDWNGAMNTIDSAINTVATTASGAAGDITTLQSDLQTLSGTVTTQGTSISTLASSLSTLTGTVNTITSLIGNGEPTTTDKTIIGAINELHSDIQQIVISVDADDVSYNNTTSHLLATNVQSAIDELYASIPDTEANYRDYAIYIGNSIAAGIGSTSTDTGVFKLTKSFFKAAKLFSGGGTGFYAYDAAHTSDTYETHLDDAIADASVDNSKVTCIVIIGAHGDSRCIATNRTNFQTVIASFDTAVSSFVTKARNAFPNLKKIIYANCDCRAHNAITYNGLTYYAADSYDLKLALAPSLNIYGVDYLGNVGHAINFIDTCYSADGYHPNDTGYSRMSNMMLQMLEGGRNTRVIEQTCDIDAQAFTGVADSTIHFNCQIKEDQIINKMTYISVPSGNQLAISTNSVDISWPNDDEITVIGHNSQGLRILNGNEDKYMLITPYVNKFTIGSSVAITGAARPIPLNVTFVS